MKNCQQYNEEDLDVYYRVQLTSKKLEYILVHTFDEPQTKFYETSPRITQLTYKNNAFKETFKFEAAEKIMKTIWTTHQEKILNLELDDVLVFTKKNYPVGTELSRKSTNKTKIDKIHWKCNCVDGLSIGGRWESIHFLSILVLHLVLKFSKSLHHFFQGSGKRCFWWYYNSSRRRWQQHCWFYWWHIDVCSGVYKIMNVFYLS